MRADVGRLRWLAVVAVLGLLATTVLTFGIAVAKTVDLIDKVLSGGWKDELVIVSVLEVVDTHLLGIVQLIVAIELFELFVGGTTGPRWLQARSLDDLKKPIADFLVLFVAIQGIAKYLQAETGDDQLDTMLAAGVLIAALTGFRLLTSLAKGAAKPDAKPDVTAG